MPEVSRWVISGKILTLSVNEGGFGKLKNRLGMISGRNIKRVRIRWWKPQVPITDSTRASCVKPGFGRFRSRERMRNVRLHARHYHLCYALSTQRRVSVTEAVIIPRKIRSSQLAEAKRQRHLRFRGSWGGLGEIGKDTDMRLWSEEPYG